MTTTRGKRPKDRGWAPVTVHKRQSTVAKNPGKIEKQKNTNEKHLSRHPIPPKITTPRPANIFPRERLFALLDRLRKDHRVIWVSAPGGAGKTSLAASYLAARQLPVFWCQMDPGDGDLASFFYYMGLAAKQAAPRYKRSLPLLMPEYLGDIPTFTRNFFRELYRRQPDRSVIVLDNYQDAPEESNLHDVLHIAMNEVPEGMNFLVLSRNEPPAALARLRLCDHAACLDWGEIQLTPEETAGISAVRVGKESLDDRALATLHDRSQGWAAGVVLMLEQSKRANALDAHQAPTDQRLLFDYFAREILNRSEPPIQEFLLKTAILRKITSTVARELTGNVHSQAILDDLTRRNYFTVRRPGPKEDSYEFHPLFREFLLTHLGNTQTPAELVPLRRRGAQLLEKDGSFEEAVDLYHLACDWGSMTRLILAGAPALLQQSRHQTLARWIGQLPEVVIEQEPWLMYWRGQCHVLIAPGEARTALERAYAVFDTRDEPAGLYLSWAAIIDSFFIEWNNFTPAGRWITAFESLRLRHPRFPSPEIEPRVAFAAVLVLSRRQPEHPELPAWVARAEQLLDSIADINQRILSGTFLHLYYIWLGQYDQAEKFSAPLPANADVQPQCRLMHLIGRVVNQWCFGDPRSTFRQIEEGLQIIESHGLQYWKYQLSAQGVYAGCACGDLESATRYLERMSPLAGDRGAVDVASYHHLVSMVAWHRQDLSSAATHAETSLRIAEEIGMVFAEACCQFMVATLAIARGEMELATKRLVVTRRLGKRLGSPWVAYMCSMGEAYLAIQEGRLAQCLQLLREALAMSRERGTPSLPWMPHTILARLYAVALEHDIERDQVRALIRKFGIAPDDNAFLPDTWPFPVKVYTLGRFSLVVNDKPLPRSAGHKRPLELLQVLIALGGREVEEDKLAETLWPEAEGDVARQNLKVNVHRLRKFLPESAIVWSEGRLSLDARQTWVDLWALERELGRLDQSSPADVPKQAELVTRVFSLYRGVFLSEITAPWALAARERLRNKTLRVVARAAESLGRRDPAAAVPIFEKAIELDPLREPLYQGLMRCYHQLRQPAEGLRIYQRCRDTLQRDLDLTPSPVTEALRQSLKTG